MERGMRKLSRTRSLDLRRDTLDTYLTDTRQRRIPGATITSRPGSRDIDLSAFFARPTIDATVAGAAPGQATRAGRPAKGTVSLSDGTRITFATADRYETAGLV
jgi:hypothetical protein